MKEGEILAQLKPGYRTFTTSLPGDIIDTLKILAIKEKKAVNSIILEAVSLYLIKRGMKQDKLEH